MREYVAVLGDGEVSICEVSMEEMEAIYGASSWKPLLAAGGFAASYIDSALLEKARELYKGNETVLDTIESAKQGHSVAILSDIKELMSEESVEALIQHELGHVHHDHVRAMSDSALQESIVKVGNASLIDVDSFEREADAYAAETVGYHRLLSALDEVLRAQAKVVSAALGKSAEEFYTYCKTEFSKTQRYAELMKYTEGY